MTAVESSRTIDQGLSQIHSTHTESDFYYIYIYIYIYYCEKERKK